MSKSYYNNPINGDEHVREQLSDYMDGLLPDSDRKAVRAHLEECADCRADYIELRAAQRAMQSLPTLAAPRAFTLTPEMARQARKPSFWESFFVPRNAPRLATGSLVAFLLLALFVGNDFLGNTTSSPDSAMHIEQPAPFASSGGAQSRLPAVSTATTAAAAAQIVPNGAAAAPTSTTQASAGGSSTHSAPAAPNASTSSNETSTAEADTSAKQASPPDTGVGASGNGSPTTTTLLAPSTPGVGASVPEVAPQAAATPSDNSGAGLFLLQAGLLVVALGLAAAAIIAWRHT